MEGNSSAVPSSAQISTSKASSWRVLGDDDHAGERVAVRWRHAVWNNCAWSLPLVLATWNRSLARRCSRGCATSAPPPRPRRGAAGPGRGRWRRGGPDGRADGNGRDPAPRRARRQMVQADSLRLDNIRGSARLGSARLGSARLGSARLGSARLGSARLGLIILFAPSPWCKRSQGHCSPLRDCRRGGRRADPAPSDRAPARATADRRPPATPGRTAGGRRDLCTKPLADRMATLPVAHRSSHVPDRLARCESVEGAMCRTRVPPSATVRTSHD